MLKIYKIKTESGSEHEVTCQVSGLLFKKYKWQIRDKHGVDYDIVMLGSPKTGEMIFAEDIKKIKQFKGLMVVFNPKVNRPAELKKLFSNPKYKVLIKKMRHRTSPVEHYKKEDTISIAA